jgi:hypothetical protein
MTVDDMMNSSISRRSSSRSKTLTYCHIAFLLLLLLLLVQVYECNSSSSSSNSSIERITKKKTKTRITNPIGWKESISFTEWGIKNLVSKTDTGARTSAIDCENVRVRMVNTTKVADFDVILSRKDRKQVLRLENVPVKSETRVKSSNGLTSVRVRVTTSVKVGTVCLHNVDFTLAPRSNMICPVLLGRDAIRGKFVVDSRNKYVLSKKRYKTKIARRKHKLRKRHCTSSTSSSSSVASKNIFFDVPEVIVEEVDTEPLIIVPPTITRTSDSVRKRSMIELPYQVVITFSLMLFVIMMTLLSKSS